MRQRFSVPGLVLIVLALSGSLACQSPPPPSAEAVEAGADEWLDVARRAALWIDAARIESPDGLAWPADPRAPGSVVTNLYSGTPGVVLFFLELDRLDPQGGWRSRALGGARALAATLPAADEETLDWGLYTGLSGRCLAILRAARATAADDLEEAGTTCLERVIDRAGADTGWGPVTDIIGGTAGIGSFLLWAAERLGRIEAVEAAARAGDLLLAAARETANGLEWSMAPDFPRLMPNFSHGTAGIVFFLARLHAATGDRRYLDAAIAGGRHLQAIADTEGDVCLIYHDAPEGTDLYYLSWCHGPAGTGRTFYALWQATGEREWLEWTHRSAAAVLASGIPESRTPGFWNNVSLCCGNAGVADFFLDLYAVSGRDDYLHFSRRVIADLMDRATRDDAGIRWEQAEHRVRPEEVIAQTGWMQGAAGIGAVLLHLRAVERQETRPEPLPDNPFDRGD